MADERYPPTRAGTRFAVGAAATALVGVAAGWGLKSAVRRGTVVGAAVAAGDYALWRFLGQLPELEGELEDRADEIEVEIEDAVDDG
jgi:hypothetical protein